MKYILSTICFLLAPFCITSYAENLSQEQAKKVAETCLQKTGMKRFSKQNINLQSVKHGLKVDALNPEYYVFKPTTGEGFVIVSGEDCTNPIIGYSTTSILDLNNMPCAFVEFMNAYAHYIDNVRSGRSIAKDNYTPEVVVEPLLKTTWGQSGPFAYACPKIDGKEVPCGCVATAMAQVMKYYEWPSNSMGTGRYTTDNNVDIIMKTLSTAFDWANMLDAYSDGSRWYSYSSVQRDAVANLTRDCGYSVGMNYGLDGSGTKTREVPKALKNNFGYGEGVYCADRADYDSKAWRNLIMSSLEKGVPVVYAGASSESGGHCFVCDGVSENGLFHINWGWDGNGDGYFDLDNLEFSLGGQHDYNYSQEAIIDFYPPGYTPQPNPPSGGGEDPNIGDKEKDNLVTLIIEMKDGTELSYTLEEQPRISFTNHGFHLTTNNVTVDYKLSEVEGFHFYEPDGIESIHSDTFQFRYSNGVINVSGLAVNDYVKIIDASGKVMLEQTSFVNGELTQSLYGWKSGLYVVNISNRQSIKIKY